MDFSKKLIEEYEVKANRTLALICRISAIFLLAIMFLNYLGIFKIMWVIYPVLFAFFVLLFLPTLFYNVLNIHERYLQYIFLAMIVLYAGVLYCVLDYHVIMMFLFPILLSGLYVDKKVVLFTILLGFPVIVGSHVLAFILNQSFSIVPDEPATTWKGLYLYGMTPRLIEYCIFSIIGYAIAIRLNRLVGTLKNKNNEIYFENEKIIKSLSDLVDHDTHETGDHIERVSKVTEIVCKKLGMTDEEAWTVSTAAMLHDIGKITIDRSILQKEGPLLESEFDIVKQHSTKGYTMLKDSESEVMRIASLIAYQHHEKYDGSGYPNGIKGDEISFNARIVSVCDVYDAIVSKRCYKPAEDPKEAIDFLVSQKGKHFDPHIVDVFVENLEEIKKVYEK